MRHTPGSAWVSVSLRGIFFSPGAPRGRFRHDPKMHQPSAYPPLAVPLRAFGGLGRPPNGAWGCPRAISNPDAAQRSSAATKRERKRRPVSGHPAITPGGETFSRTRAVDLA
jgi:hypothetical protein